MGVAMLFFFSGIILGWLFEWGAHKYLLHNFNKKIFSYSHFSIHHQNCRKNDFYDSDYESFPPSAMSSGLKELVLLASALVVTLPAILVSSYLWLGFLVHACLYYFVHRKCHLDVEWGKKWVPWHYQHHMGKDQNCNWGVTSPFFDYVFRTRKK